MDYLKRNEYLKGGKDNLNLEVRVGKGVNEQRNVCQVFKISENGCIKYI